MLVFLYFLLIPLIFCSVPPFNVSKSKEKLKFLIITRYPLKYVNGQLKFRFSPFESEQQRSAYLGLLLFEAYGKSYRMKMLLKLISGFIQRKNDEHFSGLKIFTDDPESRIFDPYKLDFEGEEFRNVLTPHPDFEKWLAVASINDSVIKEILQIEPIYGKNLSTRQLLLDGYNVIKAILNNFHRPLAMDSNLDIILSTFLLKCFTNPVEKARIYFPERKLWYAKVLSLSLVPSICHSLEADLLELLLRSSKKIVTSLNELPYITKHSIGLLASVINYSSHRIRQAILKNPQWLRYFCKDEDINYSLYLIILQKLIIDSNLKKDIIIEKFEINNYYSLASNYPSTFSLKDIHYIPNERHTFIYNNDSSRMLCILKPDGKLLITMQNFKIYTTENGSYFAVEISPKNSKDSYIGHIKSILLKAKALVKSDGESARHFLVNNRIIHLY